MAENSNRRQLTLRQR